MNFRKFEIFLFFLFSCLCGLAWFYSDRTTRNELDKLLTVEEQQFKNIEFEQIKQSMEKELMRRLSYHFYTGQIKEFNSFVRSRYEATKVNITRNENQGANLASKLKWNWHNEAKKMFLEGQNCNQDLCLDIKIPWTRAWLEDGSESLVNQLSKMSSIGWTTLLESSELNVPKVVKEYVSMTDQLEGLKIGRQLFYGSKFGPSKFNLHRLTVVNGDKLRQERIKNFTGLFWLIFCMITSIYLISYFWDHELYSTYRILIMILLVILLPGIILSLQSTVFVREQASQIRHQREVEVINHSALSVIKPSFARVRHLLPFQDGGIYSIRDKDDLLLFTATFGQLRGKQYLDKREDKTKDLLTLILLFCFSVVAYLRLFRDSNRFWNQFNERLEKQMVNAETGPISEEFSENTVYDYWDLWRSQLDTEKQVQRRALQQRLINFDSDALMKNSIISDSKSYPKDLNCVVVCVGPSNTENLEVKPAKDYFDDLNKFLEIFRDTCLKYEGTPFMDSHWSQRAFFSFPKSFLSCQRAVLFGLDFIKQLKELDLLSEVSYRVIATQGCLTFAKVGGGFKHEIFVKGSVLQECDEAMDLLENSNGFWIHSDLFTDSLNSSFSFSSNKLDEWHKVIGIKNVEDHLSLLDFPSSELQRSALELLSFKPDEVVLDKILDKLATLESEVEDQALNIVSDYLHSNESRSKVFDQIIRWSEKGYDEIVLKVLIELKKQSVDLNKNEIEILLNLRKQIHEEVCLSLVLENADLESLEKLEFRLSSSSNFIKSRFILIKFNQKPSSEYLDQLHRYLEATDHNFLAHILEIWCEIKVIEQSIAGSCFSEWFNEKKDVFLIRILELVESENISIKLKSLRVISNLKLSEAEFQLVRIFYDCRDPELKSEIAFTLQNIGSSAYLLRNLN